MFEKTKKYILDGYIGSGAEVEGRLGGRLTYCSIKKESLHGMPDGDANIVEIQHFSDDGSMIICSIPEFKEAILQCAVLFEVGVDCDKVHDILLDALKETAANLGLEFYTYNAYGLYFGANDREKLNLVKKQDSSVRFYNDRKYHFPLPDTAGAINYGTLVDDKIVSVSASTYLSPFHSEVVVISIKTLEEYRQKGYGVSNVVSLADYLLSGSEEVRQVKEVLYCTNNINVNSQKTAKSAGFTEISKEYVLCCRQI